MEKIPFENYPNISTPLSAEVLNKMQENIEENKYIQTIDTTMTAGAELTIPCKYKVRNRNIRRILKRRKTDKKF